MNFTISVYQRKRGAYLEWTTLSLGPFSKSRSAISPAKVEQLLLDDLKGAIRAATSKEMVHLTAQRGTRLVRLRADMALSNGASRRRFTGEIPLILEQRRFSGTKTVTIAFHPHRQTEWFPVDEMENLSDAAHAYLSRTFASCSDSALEELKTDGKDLLKVIAFSATPKSLLDGVRAKDKGVWDDLALDPARASKKKSSGGSKVLSAVGQDVTQQLLPRTSLPGLPRSPFREQLEALLTGKKRQPVFLVGPAGVGKTTLIEQWAWDLSRAEGYDTHRNADRLTKVWRISGKRLIAGMSHVGEWEQRAVDLFEEVRHSPVVLHITDVFRFGKLGRARDSDRSLADLFRGAMARGDISVVAEGTSEQLAQLEEDAPSLAALFVRLPLPEPSLGQAFRVLLSEARRIELERQLEIAPMALRALLELSTSFGGARAQPGRAIQLLSRVVDHADAAAAEDGKRVIDVPEVIGAMSAKLGLSRALLAKEAPLERAEVERQLALQVLGQPEATRAASELVARIKANLVDPRRPYGVFLFTGPTGTGKTELARCIAEYLFGDQRRLVRLDMSEFSGRDAVGRLVGDAFEPEGLLTTAVREQPLSVVLLDEIDKAHPSVHGLLLQLFEDARLTSAGGTTVSFENTVVIMTSNVGARQRAPIGWGADPSAALSDVARAVREFFSPELFNRIDRVVAFRPLAPEVAIDVAEKELARLKSRRGLEMRNTFLEVSRSIVERVAREALLAKEGARSLKRFLEERIAVPVAELVSSQPAAEMRMIYLFEDAGGTDLAIRDERMAEAPALHSAHLELERLATATIAELQRTIAARREGLHRLRAHAQRLLHETPHDSSDGGRRFWIEATADLTNHLVARADRAASAVVAAVPDGPTHEVRTFGSGWDHTVTRVRLTPRHGRPHSAPLSREDMLGLVAHIQHLERVVRRANQPEEHEVVVELVRIASPKAPRFQDALGAPSGTKAATLIDWLVRAYLAFAEELNGDAEGLRAFEAAAVVRSGKALEVTQTNLEKETQGRLDCLVLALSGVGLRDALANEEGSHVWQALATSPEIVRVRLLPAGTRPIDAARDYVARASAFRKAMGSGGAAAAGAPENPAKLLPMVRRFRFEPPLREGRLAPIELEDFVLGLATEPPVRDPVEMVRRILWLRASRAEEVTS